MLLLSDLILRTSPKEQMPASNAQDWTQRANVPLTITYGALFSQYAPFAPTPSHIEALHC